MSETDKHIIELACALSKSAKDELLKRLGVGKQRRVSRRSRLDNVDIGI